jgi:hypothetical protein
MVVKTRTSSARPDREERLENVARRCHVKKSIAKAQQDEPFKELLTIIGKNGGKLPYGEMNKLVSNYNKNGFKAVTHDSLYYRLKKCKAGNSCESIIGATVNTSSKSQGIISDITEEVILTDVSNTHPEVQLETNTSTKKNIGGRKKGSTKKFKIDNEKKRKEVVTKCACLYKDAIEEAKKSGLANVPNETLKKNCK